MLYQKRRKNVSLCCQSPALTAGIGRNRWYLCKKCRKPCDLEAPTTKFNNIQKWYNGQMYHSTLEASYAAHLDLLIKAREVASWESQVRFKLTVNDRKITTIIPDFLVTTVHGGEEIHEVKGKSTPDWVIKWRLLQALHPEYKYVVIRRGDF